MPLIHPLSCECVKSELDLFGVPLTQTSVEEGRWVEYGPITAVKDSDDTIEFKIAETDSEYIDLKNSFIRVKAKIVDADGEILGATADVAPVNFWLHALFSQIDMTLKDNLVTTSNNTYPYKAYIETVLSFGTESKQSQLTASMWYKDTNNFSLDQHNEGYVKRKELARESHLIDMMGKLHLDLMFQDRYILNHTPIKLRLTRSKDKFAIVSPTDNTVFRVKLDSVKMMIRKVQVNSVIQAAHAKALEMGTAKYPITRGECKTYTVSSGTRSHAEENLYSGQIPKRIVIGFVRNSGINGTYQTNPFQFEHFDMDHIALNVGGTSVPGKALQPDFETGDYMNCYMTLFSGMGSVYQDEGNHIDREEYKKGYTLICFDLSPDLEEGGGYVNLRKTGTVSLEVHFKKELTETVNIVVYGEFENTIEIDQYRSVVTDFTL